MAVSPEQVGKTPRVISEEEYYELAEKSEVRLEFVGGQIRSQGDGGPSAMAGASVTHVKLTNFVAFALTSRLLDGSCYVGSSDLRVKVEATNEKFYPDVVVFCEDARFDQERLDTLLSPVVLVEVLSPSTGAYDLNEKLVAYRQIPTLRHYLIVEQRRVRVQHHRRVETDEWRLDIYNWRREEIVLDDLGIRIPLDEIYRRLDVPEGLILLPTEDTALE